MALTIQQIDVFVIRRNQHYKVAGHTEAPGRLPGTDYYIEPQWLHAYSRVVEACLVKVTADNGAVGWGEVQAPLTPQTPCALITTLLGPSLLGQDALATTALFERMYHLMLARGHAGSFLADAMAGLDIALWDLKGRHYEAPLFDLAGGAHRMELPAYSSGLRAQGVAAKVELARKFMGSGFAGVKLFTGEKITAVEEEVREVRAAIGTDAFLAVDAICKYDLAGARQIGGALDAAKASWFEAPLNAEDIDGHAALARTIATPIAIGETLRTPRQFEPWLRARALAVAQPDLMRCGVTGALRIATLAQTAHVPTTLHTGICTGIGMAATWQIMAALPGDTVQEHQEDLFATACDVLDEPLEKRAGRLVVPARPGLGVNVNEAAVRKITTEYWVVDAGGRRQIAAARGE